MNYRFKDDNQLRRGKNWMSAMGVLFIVMAVVIALRNLYFVSTQLSFEFYLDNYTNGDITNEKFVIAMLIGGGFLLYWGRFRKKMMMMRLTIMIIVEDHHHQANLIM